MPNIIYYIISSVVTALLAFFLIRETVRAKRKCGAISKVNIAIVALWIVLMILWNISLCLTISSGEMKRIIIYIILYALGAANCILHMVQLRKLNKK